MNLFKRLFGKGKKNPLSIEDIIPTKEVLLNTEYTMRQQVIAWYIFNHITDYDIEQHYNIRNMGKSFGLINALWHYEGEVNNGGHLQYFDNFENNNKLRDEYYDFTYRCLLDLECDIFAEKYNESVELYKKYIQSTDEADQEKISEQLSTLDSWYYENEKTLISATDRYIEKHLDDFVVEV